MKKPSATKSVAAAKATASKMGIVATVHKVAISANPPASNVSVPSITTPVKVPWGDWLVQFEEAVKPMAEATGAVAVDSLLNLVPGIGPILHQFIGPKIVKQWVDLLITTVEGYEKGKSFEIPNSSAVLTAFTQTIVDNEAVIAKYLGDKLGPLIQAELKNLGVTLT